jgi:peptidoglycan hydrolase CwlO-like protein
MKPAALLVGVAVALLAQQPSRGPAATGADPSSRIAVLETKVEALSSDVQRLQQKVDTLLIQVQDLNTKVNLVLVVASVIFGALITQMAGIVGRRKQSEPVTSASESPRQVPPSVLELLLAESRLAGDLRTENAALQERVHALQSAFEENKQSAEKLRALEMRLAAAEAELRSVRQT